MVVFALTALVVSSALGRGLAPTPTPVRAEPPARVESNDRVRFPEPPPVPRSKRPLDPAAVHARMQAPRSADLRNPFEIVPSKRPSFGPPPDLKDPFAGREGVKVGRAPPPSAMVAIPISPDLRYPFPKPRKNAKADKPAKAARRNERATPPPPPPAPCVTDEGVPVQRPRAVRPTAPPCPPPVRAASPRTRK
jgi:hypothetical protein